MKLSRRSCLATAFLALVSVLFVQLAVAAYACPSRQIVQASQDAAMATQGHGHMEGCEGMAGGATDTALCHAHCQPDTQSLDKPGLPDVSPFVAARGAPGIRTENALLSAYIYVDIRDRDIGSYVADARKAVSEQVKFPPGYYATWSGQFEAMERAVGKMKIVVPATLLIIFLLLYLNFKRLTETLIVMLSVPFALVGGVWLMWLLGYNMSVAVAVGFIALAGVAAETGVVMLIYLDHAWEEMKAKCRVVGTRPSATELYAAVMEGAVERVRPKMMTVVAIMAGLLPIMWETGTGSEVMSRIAAPMVGGMISSTILTLGVIPALYALVKQWRLDKGMER